MKETKKFFDNNRLNKGYDKVNVRKNDASITAEKYKNLFPPIDIIAQYEELSPGTFEKFLDMTATEQHHRHALELSNAERLHRATKLGQIFMLMLVSIVSLVTVFLALQGYTSIAIIFCTAAFASIAVASFCVTRSPVLDPSSSIRHHYPPRDRKHFRPKNR